MDVSQYLEIFIDETKEHLQSLNEQLLILEKEPENAETINEIFRAESVEIEGKYIQLGIGSDELEYKASDAGNIVAFVKEGELWSYHQNENSFIITLLIRTSCICTLKERANYAKSAANCR